MKKKQASERKIVSVSFGSSEKDRELLDFVGSSGPSIKRCIAFAMQKMKDEKNEKPNR